MAENTYSRKLDSMGRIMIPSKLREQMGLVIGEEYEFSIMEKNGKHYICIDCGACDELNEAKEILRKHGYNFND